MIKYRNKKTGEFYSFLAICTINGEGGDTTQGIVYSPEALPNVIEVIEFYAFYNEFEEVAV